MEKIEFHQEPIKPLINLDDETTPMEFNDRHGCRYDAPGQCGPLDAGFPQQQIQTGPMNLPLRWMVVIVLLEILPACGVHVPITPQPPASVSTNSLQTAHEYLVRGDSFAASKDYSQAILAYDQAIRLKPEYAEAYNNRGYAYYWSGNAAQAIADYSRALELRPNYAYAYNNRGAAYMASGNPSEAISDFDHALAIQPDFPQAYINRGNAYLRLGHFSMAFADFRQGGANPIRTIVPLCGIPAIMIFLGALLMNTIRQHALAKRHRTIEKE